MDDPEAAQATAQAHSSALEKQIETFLSSMRLGQGPWTAVPALLDQMQYLHKMRLLTEYPWPISESIWEPPIHLLPLF